MRVTIGDAGKRTSSGASIPELKPVGLVIALARYRPITRRILAYDSRRHKMCGRPKLAFHYAGAQNFREADQEVNGDDEKIAHESNAITPATLQDCTIPNARAMICEFAPHTLTPARVIQAKM